MHPSAKNNQNSQLHFIASNCLTLPFNDNTFDVVFGSLVLHQIPDLINVILEIKRVLSSAGHYIGIEINPYHPVHLYKYFFSKHSANQYLLSEKDLSFFEDYGFKINIRYFYGKIPWVHNRFLSTTMGIIARKIQ